MNLEPSLWGQRGGHDCHPSSAIGQLFHRKKNIVASFVIDVLSAVYRYGATINPDR